MNQSPFLASPVDKTDSGLEPWRSEALAATGTGCWTCRIDGSDWQWDAGFAALLGCAAGGASDLDFLLDRIHRDDREVLDGFLAGLAQAAGQSMECSLRCIQQGHAPSWVELRGRQRGDRLVGVASDCSRVRSVQARLVQACESVAAVSGADFLAALVQQLARCLGADHTIVATIDREHDLVTTLACWTPDGPGRNYSFLLAGTACETVIGDGRVCAIAEGVQQRYPDDHLLQQLGIASFLGMPLQDGDRPIGLLMACYRRPMPLLADHGQILRMFAARCAAEVVRRELTADLVHSRNSSRSLVETAQEGICLVDPVNGALRQVNRRAAQLYGYPVAELLQLHFAELLPPDPDETDHLRQELATYLDRARRGERLTVRLLQARRDGSSFLGEVRLDALVDEDYGVLVRVCVTDISERELMVDELERREAHVRAIVESIADGVIEVDRAGLVASCNRQAESLLQLDRRQAIGQRAVDLLTLDGVGDWLDAALAKGHGFHSEQPEALLREDGSVVRLRCSVRPIRYGSDIVGAVVALRDVTADIDREEQLRQAQKMETVGQLAGGIAHDFNNMLAGILGTADLLDLKMPADSPMRRHVRLIGDAARRAADLTAQLLSFSRKGARQQQSLDLVEVLRQAIDLARRSIDRKIAIEAGILVDCAPVQGDVSQLQNAFLNILLNARDAMPEGGTIHIAMRSVDLADSANATVVLPAQYGPAVEVEIWDEGRGIDDVIRDRLFEPFFTTKQVGRGTGLGLAAVYGTISDHEGHLVVGNRPDAGASFRCILPVTEYEDRDASSDGFTSRSASGTILVVEDEDLVRTMVENLLVGLGYDVVLAVDGADGWEQYQAHADRIDALLLDIVMPRMSGDQLLRQLRDAGHDVPVLLTSGYVRDAAVDELVALPGVDFLEKPYRVGDLSRCLDRLLAARAGP